VYRAILSLFLVIACQQVQAFGFPTHARVCANAYELLTPVARQSVDRLVTLSSEKSFAQLCGWPDQIRRNDDFRHTGRWHYINVPRTADQVTEAHCPEDGCVLSALSDMQARLSSAPQVDWQALAFVGHLVADIHQPLHVSYADDRGGNDTRVRYQGDRTNLHALWDRDVPMATADIRETMAPAGSDTLTALDWANESLQKTQQIYQYYRRGQTITDDQMKNEGRWMQARIEQATTRLADVLNRIFAD